MLGFLNSLSIGSRAGLVALVSALLAVAYAQLSSQRAVWILNLGMPFIVSYSLYWSPVWLGADSLEYGAWAPLFIVPWYLAGLLVSTIVVSLFEKRGRR